MDLPESLRDQVRYATAAMRSRLESGGEVSGTACFFYFGAGEGRSVPVLLATRQLLGGASTAEFTFQDGVEREGGLEPVGATFTLEVRDLPRLVLAHPDPDVDLAALPLRSLQAVARRGGHRIFHIPLEEAFLGTKPVLEGLHRHERVVTVGFPSGRWEEEGMPVVREGATGTHPREDFRDRAIGVVDTPCLPGTSGSPVLILDEAGFRTGGREVEGERMILLGILSSRPVEMPEGVVPPGDAPDPAHYVKAQRIVELGREIRTRLGLR